MIDKLEVQCPYCKDKVEIGSPESGITCCRNCNKSVRFQPFKAPEPKPKYDEDTSNTDADMWWD